MRKGLCVAVLLGLVCLMAAESALGQQGGQQRDRRRGAGRFIERLKNELGLTDEQVQKITSLNETYRQKRREAGRDAEKRQAARDEYQTALKAVLTPEQQTKYDAMMSRMRQGFRRTTALSTATRLDAALRRLNLSEAVQQKVEALRKERDAKIEAAANAFKDAVMPQLTPEQQKTLKQALEQPRGRTGDRTGGQRGRRRNQGGGGDN